MINRDAISQALAQLLLKVQGHDSDQVQVQSLLLIDELERLIRPIPDPTKTVHGLVPIVVPAEQLGLSSANVRYVRSLISEAVALSNSTNWHAAENAVQHAVDRWNEEERCE
jgi:hypothetical protein